MEKNGDVKVVKPSIFDFMAVNLAKFIKSS